MTQYNDSISEQEIITEISEYINDSKFISKYDSTIIEDLSISFDDDDNSYYIKDYNETISLQAETIEEVWELLKDGYFKIFEDILPDLDEL